MTTWCNHCGDELTDETADAFWEHARLTHPSLYELIKGFPPSWEY